MGGSLAARNHEHEEAVLMKLLIVIPALNEEDSIESIIQRSLDARSSIIAQSHVTEVEIAVVSDGSTTMMNRRANACSSWVSRKWEQSQAHDC